MLTSLWKMGGSGNTSRCEDLAISIQAEVSTLYHLSESCCIYKVPKLLLDVNQAAYTPVSVSIGPFHHKNKRLLSMETHKLKYLQHWLQTRPDLTTYLEIIKYKEARIRGSYSEPIHDLSSDEFTRMVLVDSIFIIQLFKTGRVIKPLTLAELKHDLTLAENQLPYFILEDLYCAAFRPHMNTTIRSFTEIACDWLDINIPITGPDFRSVLNSNHTPRQSTQYCHILDLVRSHYLPSLQIDESGDRDVEQGSVLCRNATSLYGAGVKFCAAQSDTNSLLDIHFNKVKAVLTIPLLTVDDTIESLLRNLLAFEQCYYRHNTVLADYLLFLDCLINTVEDVQLLVKSEVIQNLLGSDNGVADLINSMGTHISYSNPDRYYYARTTRQLNHHYKMKWNRYVATLRHTYLRHPWAVLSLIYAFILLLLTFIQVSTGILAVPGVI